MAATYLDQIASGRAAVTSASTSSGHNGPNAYGRLVPQADICSAAYGDLIRQWQQPCDAACEGAQLRLSTERIHGGEHLVFDRWPAPGDRRCAIVMRTWRLRGIVLPRA